MEGWAARIKLGWPWLPILDLVVTLVIVAACGPSEHDSPVPATSTIAIPADSAPPAYEPETTNHLRARMATLGIPQQSRPGERESRVAAGAGLPLMPDRVTSDSQEGLSISPACGVYEMS